MGWTTETPTKPGYYWCVQVGELRPGFNVVRVWHAGDDLPLVVDVAGVEDSYDMSQLPGALWCGPLLPPEGAGSPQAV